MAATHDKYVTFIVLSSWFVCDRLLVIDNFIPPNDKNKILSRAEFDEEEGTWRLKALAKGGSV